MFEISSEISEQNLAEFGIEENTKFPRGSKMFYQINESKLLEDLIEVLLGR